MMIWTRGLNRWSVLLVGLGVAGLGFTACDNTALVGVQSDGGGGTSPSGGAGTWPTFDGGASVTGSAGTSPTGAAGTGPAPVEGLGSEAGGQAGPWLFFDSMRALNRDIYAIQPDGSSLKRLTTSPAIDREPAVSPDGKTLAFASDRSGSFQVYLMPLPGGAIRPITHSASGADQPAWSPDGKRLAFHSGVSIYLIEADGQGERLLASEPYAGIGTGHPMFVSDGVLLYDTYHRIYSLELATGASTMLGTTTAPLQHPSLSPDGHLIAYNTMCESGVNSVWLTPLASFDTVCSGGTRVTPGGAYARFASISSTGLIAFETGAVPDPYAAPGPAHIGLADGALNVKDVTNGEGDDRNASWSPASLLLP